MSDSVVNTWRGKVQVPDEIGGKKVKAFMGWNGLVVNSDQVNVLDICRTFMKNVVSVACGECSTGYNGVRLVSTMLDSLNEKDGAERLGEIKTLAADIQENTKCDFCAFSVTPVIDVIDRFGPDLLTPRQPAEAVDYLVEVAAPCSLTCPAGQDIPGYIELIRNHRYEDALKTILETNCMPATTGRACVAFCEDNCVRDQIDESISIRALKRVPADLAGKVEQNAPGTIGAKVAVIGAGPAGLACSRELARQGLKVTIYDEQPRPGGMTFAGIPGYRLPGEALQADVDGVQKLGVEIISGKRVELADIPGDYQAVFIATGAHQSRPPGIDNWDSDNDSLIQGVKFLSLISQAEQIKVGRKVAVVGGGNTAIDCARTAVRLGAGEVTIMYRRSRQEMPARDEEVEAAGKEGVKLMFLTLPVKVLNQGGQVSGVECIRMELGEPDDSGRRRPVPVKGSEFQVEADMVIPAIGEVPDTSFAGDIELTDWGTIKVNPDMETSVKGVFAGGDCVNGPGTIVEAIAAGKKAAAGILSYVTGSRQDTCEIPAELNGLLKDITIPFKTVGPVKRTDPPELGLEERLKGTAEVEQRYTISQADGESSRCLRCYRVVLAAL